MPQAAVEAGQVTEPAPVEEHQTDEQRYQEEIAQLEAAIRSAEDVYDQAEQAVWAQAHRSAACAAIDHVGGFRRPLTTPPSETRERRWRETPQKEQAALERLVKTREDALHGIEPARANLRQTQVQWQRARAEAAFLATPEAQFLTRELEETCAAYEVANAANQGAMVGVLVRKREAVKKQIVSARRAWSERR